MWAVPLIVIVFLWTLNEFLHGKLKTAISGVLAILVFALCAIAFFLSGWLIGLFAMVGSFVLAALFRNPALWVARKLVDYPDLGADDYSRQRVSDLLQDFGSSEYFERLTERQHADEVHMVNTVNRALARTDVQAVLRPRCLAGQDLQAFYERSEVSSLPPKLRNSSQQRENARLLFENSTATEVNGKYVRNVNDRTVAMTLSLWAKDNPAGQRCDRISPGVR